MLSTYDEVENDEVSGWQEVEQFPPCSAALNLPAGGNFGEYLGSNSEEEVMEDYFFHRKTLWKYCVVVQVVSPHQRGVPYRIGFYDPVNEVRAISQRKGITNRQDGVDWIMIRIPPWPIQAVVVSEYEKTYLKLMDDPVPFEIMGIDIY